MMETSIQLWYVLEGRCGIDEGKAPESGVRNLRATVSWRDSTIIKRRGMCLKHMRLICDMLSHVVGALGKGT